MSEDAAAAMAGLRASGADAFDRVRFHFIEALARRAAAHAGPTRRLLDHKLDLAVAAYAARLAQAGWQAGAELPSLRGAGDFGQMRQHGHHFAATGNDASLADLVRRLAPDAAALDGEHPPELRTLQRHRATWSRLHLERRLAQSHAVAPAQAGPLHSNVLALRALASMREISPDYFNRFMGYVDALMWLEQASGGAASAPKNVVGGKGTATTSRRRNKPVA